jgi:hypothetical protein
MNYPHLQRLCLGFLTKAQQDNRQLSVGVLSMGDAIAFEVQPDRFA